MNPIIDIRSWNDFVGLDRQVRILKKLLEHILSGGDLSLALNVLLFGKTGIGKSAMAYYFGMCVMCTNLTRSSLDACGCCSNCTDSGVINHGNAHICHAPDGPIAFTRLCCDPSARLSLKEQLDELRSFPKPVVIHLEEVGFLASGRRDRELLVPMDQRENTVWLATGTKTKELDKAFLRRFQCKLRMPRLSDAAIVNWLEAKCDEFSVDYASADLLDEVARQSDGVLAEVQNILQVARLSDPAVLDRQLVDAHFGL